MRWAKALFPTLPLVAGSGAAAAATCGVPGQFATVQDAVDDPACNPILVAAGDFPGAVNVGRNLVIRGAGRSATRLGETVTIDNDAVVGLESLAIQFTSGAGVLLASKFATLKGDDIEISFNPGFGIDHAPLATDSVADVRNCLISDNQRGVDAQFLHMDNCTVLLNRPAGGILVGLRGVIRGSTIQANENTAPTGDGGGILFDGPGGTVLEVEDSTIIANISNSGAAAGNTSDGGGIMNREGFLFVRRSVISGNVAGRWGGGVANSDAFGSNVEIHDSVIEQNIAFGGGGGVGGGNAMEIFNTTVRANQALYDEDENANGLGVGGGIYQFQDRLVLEDSRVIDNQARSQTGQLALFDGGGVYVDTDRASRIVRSSVLGNVAADDGGGLWINSETTIVNVTIADNQAGGDGGGIFGAFGPVIAHATIVDNSAAGNGGGIAASASVNHTIIGHNQDTSAAPDFHPDCSGSTVSSGFSLLRIGDGCPAFNGGSGNDAGQVGSPINLGLLRPVSDNGGPVETVALEPRGPAVDAGDRACDVAVASDARGFSRADQDGNGDGGADGDRCDLGAYEIFTGCQAAPLVLRGFEFDQPETIVSETTLSTAPSVTIGGNGEVRFIAADGVELGSGFSVVEDGILDIEVGGNVSCD